MFKKSISLFLIIFYWYSQSIFSHLLIIDHHHKPSTIQQHFHEDTSVHEEDTLALQSCKTNTDCKTMCQNREILQLTSYQSIKLFDDLDGWSDSIASPRYHIDNHNKKEQHVYSLPLWPPLSEEELMPRIWPVVRVI